MKPEKMKLRNEFHNTEAIVLTRHWESPNKYVVKRDAYDRALRRMCGIKDCRCHNISASLVVTGDQMIVWEHHKDKVIFIPKP